MPAMEKIEEIPAKRLELPPCIDILYKPEEMGGGHPFVRANKQNLSCLGHYDLPRRCPAPSSALSRPPPALAGPALVLPGDKHTTKDEGRAPFLAGLLGSFAMLLEYMSQPRIFLPVRFGKFT